MHGLHARWSVTFSQFLPMVPVPMGDERDGGSGFDGVGLGPGWGSGLDG